MGYQDVQTFVVVFLALCVGINSIGRALDTINGWKKPQTDINKQVADHETMLKNDQERLNKIEQDNKMIMNCLLSLIDHQITGNGFNDMKKTKSELQEYLVSR